MCGTPATTASKYNAGFSSSPRLLAMSECHAKVFGICRGVLVWHSGVVIRRGHIALHIVLRLRVSLYGCVTLYVLHTCCVYDEQLTVLAAGSLFDLFALLFARWRKHFTICVSHDGGVIPSPPCGCVFTHVLSPTFGVTHPLAPVGVPCRRTILLPMFCRRPA